MTSSQIQDKPPQLTFFQKFGIKYYAVLIPQLLVIFILVKTQNPSLALAFVAFYNGIGNYLPIKAKDDKHLYKIQNTNKFLLGPLISSCISTPVFIYISWKNYDIIISDSIQSNIVLILALGFVISGSINASHQLLHRTEIYAKFFSYLNLFFMQFTIYPTQHLYLHHKKVGTPHDPITSPKNKTLFSYYFNALYSCYKFNFNYSKKIFAFNVGSTLLYNFILFAAASKQGSSYNKALFFSALSYVSLFIMEGVQYIQHYGLIYRADQKQKPVLEISSWNTSENQLLNWFVFRFQRHSDHHMNAYKIYPTMELTQKMPQFPFSFVLGAVMAVIPPLWINLINPLSDQIVEGKPVSKQHRNLLGKVVLTMNIIMLSLFPIQLALHLAK